MNRVKRMRATVAALMVLSVWCVGVVRAEVESVEWSIDARALFPQRTEHWEGAGGVDLQLLLWQHERVAVGLGLGFQSWSGIYEYSVDRDSDSTLEFISDGYASVVPLGVSVHYSTPLPSRGGLMLEAGVRYLYVDSQLTIDTIYTDAHESTVLRDVVAVDDTIALVLGARLEVPLADDVRCFFGFGIQHDLGEPEEWVYGEYLDQTSFSAGYISLGVSATF